MYPHLPDDHEPPGRLCFSQAGVMHVRWLDRIDALPSAQWDGLHDRNNPFVAHAFLSGLENTGYLCEGWGWTPHHIGLWDGNELVAAAPGYLKDNSHGKFVFDHAWARAYAEHGLAYYPKWLCAVPCSPVTGPRLLAREMASRQALLQEHPRGVRQGARSRHRFPHRAWGRGQRG